MKPLLALGLTVFVATTWVSAAKACSPPPGDIAEYYARAERAYLEDVTSVYRGVLVDVVGNQDDLAVKFSVIKTGDLWGLGGESRLNLKFEQGTCSDYLIFKTEYPAGEGVADGLGVRVFVTPASRINPELLYIVPEGPVADGMMSRWRAVRASLARRSE